MCTKEKDARALLRQANSAADTAEADAKQYRALLERYQIDFLDAGMAGAADLTFALEAFGVMKNSGVKDMAELRRRLAQPTSAETREADMRGDAESTGRSSSSFEADWT